MALESPSPAGFEFAAEVALAYSALMEAADPEAGLGGRLFFAGELEEAGRACVVAANIAGAATLAATADRSAQKQAIREGVTDFLVNSLDEALRILKNELRTRKTASVCVALAPAMVEGEMVERGVQPNLVRSQLAIAAHHEALRVWEGEETATDLRKIPAVVTWRVNSALPRDLAKLDEMALSCLEGDEWQARRWLQLAPRYFGRLAQGLRLIASHREFAARFAERVSEQMDRGEIAAGTEVEFYFRGQRNQLRFNPART